MAKKKRRKAARRHKKSLAKSDQGPLKKIADAQTGDEARMGMVRAALTDKESSLLDMGVALAKGAQKWPEEIKSLTESLSESAVALCLVAGNANDVQKSYAKYVMLYRQSVIKELEVSTTAEFMLLDVAMDAYLHWMYLTALARATYKEGTGGERSKYQARVVGMAQSYLKVYADSMKALSEMKRPPIRILQIRAGENVAIQINEQTKVLEARRVDPLPQEDQRRTLPESAPAGPEATEEDSD
jgi:hypothetical protein